MITSLEFMTAEVKRQFFIDKFDSWQVFSIRPLRFPHGRYKRPLDGANTLMVMMFSAKKYRNQRSFIIIVSILTLKRWRKWPLLFWVRISRLLRVQFAISFKFHSLNILYSIK